MLEQRREASRVYGDAFLLLCALNPSHKFPLQCKVMRKVLCVETHFVCRKGIQVAKSMRGWRS